MDCGGAVFNSMVDIPITEGVESFKKASNHLLKEDYGPERLNSNLEVHDVSKRVFIQDPDSLIPEGFQVQGLSSPKKDKVQSVLEGLGIRITKEDHEGSTFRGREVASQDKVYVRRERLTKSNQPRKV